MLRVNSFTWPGLLSLWLDVTGHYRRHQHCADAIQASFHVTWWLSCSLYILRSHQSILKILLACGRSRHSQQVYLHWRHASRSLYLRPAHFISLRNHTFAFTPFIHYRNLWDVFVTASFWAALMLVLWRIAWNPELPEHPKHQPPCVFLQNLLKLCGLLPQGPVKEKLRGRIWHSLAASGCPGSWSLALKCIFRPRPDHQWLYQILIVVSSRISPCC